MKAKITKEVSNARGVPRERKLTSTWYLFATVNGIQQEAINCVIYMSRSSNASVVHASLWINGKDFIYTSGYGNSGGHGYHKESAAIAKAIESAGIKLDKDISGVGETAIKEAFKAIAKAIGYTGKIHLSHTTMQQLNLN